jgi:hypothetical protein
VLAVVQTIPADSVRRAVHEVFARPEYDWVEMVRRHWLRDLWWGLRDWLARLSTQHPTGARLLFWGALVLLIALLFHIGLTVWRIYRATVAPARAPAPGGARGLDDASGHLARADALARAGHYSEALAHRFIALVLELDRRQALVFHPAKTPAEYAREARLGDSGRASLAELVGRLYRHVFGAEPVDAAGYRDFGATATALLQHVVPH